MLNSASYISASDNIEKGRASRSHFVHRRVCPVCGNQTRKLLIDEPYDSGQVFEFVKTKYSVKGIFEPRFLDGASYRVVECPDCELIYQEYVPDEELLERIYGVWTNAVAAAERNRDALGSKATQYVKEQWLLRYWSKGRKLKVLDYGMGHGRWCEMAAAFGHSVEGYEFETTRLKSAKLNGLYNVVDYHDIPRGGYDFINTEQVFEHLTNPLEVLRHLVKGLKPGGLIRVSVPSANIVKRWISDQRNEYNFSKFGRWNLNAIEPLQHVNCYSLRTLERLGKEAGLKRYKFPLKHLIASQQDWAVPKRFVYNLLQPLVARIRYDDGSMQYFEKQGGL